MVDVLVGRATQFSPVQEFSYSYLVHEVPHAGKVLLDEVVQVDHEAFLRLELHQVGKVLHTLRHQLQSSVCRRIWHF